MRIHSPHILTGLMFWLRRIHRFRLRCLCYIRACAVLFALCVLVPWAVTAQKSGREVEIESVSVMGRLAIRNIGEQATRLDSAALRADISRSLADVLARESSIYIKSYGRATLSTASLRGTAPSHTRVTWNGMNIASPMLGMVDFSLIPSYLVDGATVWHGTSSVSVAGGGLGGAVELVTTPLRQKGLDLRFVQGVGSYRTFDEFLRIGWAGRRFQTTTRVLYSTSENDFSFINYNKKLPVLDATGAQTGEFYHPRERNKNGRFSDFHLVQELYYSSGAGDRFSLAVWYLSSSRGIPMLGTDYKAEADRRNLQKENTLRAVAGWERFFDTRKGQGLKLYARAGYIDSDMRYSVEANRGGGTMTDMIDSRSFQATIFGKAGTEYFAGKKWLLTADASFNQHFVRSIDRAINPDTAPTSTGPPPAPDSYVKIPIGYERARADLALVATARYRPTERLGLSLTLREELYGTRWTPLIPALFAEYSLLPRRNLTLKASASHNFRQPTLGDLYYMPGGNPDLRPEKGLGWDAGVEYRVSGRGLNLSLEGTWYGSRISDWILWIPSFQGHWTPVNKALVHTSGIELKGMLKWDLGRGWNLRLDASYTLSRAVNRSPQMSPDDNSTGRQLVYIPLRSNSVSGALGRGPWRFRYMYGYYSERFTSSDNNRGSIVGRIAPYYMSDVSLERSVPTRYVDLALRLAINNLFGEEYESVLSRPMPARNWGFTIEITPKFGRHK